MIMNITYIEMVFGWCTIAIGNEMEIHSNRDLPLLELAGEFLADRHHARVTLAAAKLSSFNPHVSSRVRVLPLRWVGGLEVVSGFWI